MTQTDLVEVGDSAFGKGLFARCDIHEGIVLCKATGPLMTFEDTIRLDEKEGHTMQVGINQYIYCEPPFLYSNHSCNPNCALNADLELFALQPIRKGEELFWDYSTSMYERHWTMQCQCGHKNCRGLITDFDLLPQNLQIKYLQWNIVLPFIVAAMKKQYAKTA